MPSHPRLCVVVVLALAAPATAFGQPASSPQSATAGGPSSVLFFAPTARAVPAGHGYYQLSAILFPRVQIGVTDRLSIGAGTFLLAPRFAFLTPKLQVHHGRRTSAAIGVVHMLAPSAGAGVAYAVSTIDLGPTASVTAGIGRAYTSRGDLGDWSRVRLGHVGLEWHPADDFTVIASGLVVESGGLVMVGGRRSWRTFSTDVGVVLTRAGSIPVANLTWHF